MAETPEPESTREAAAPEGSTPQEGADGDASRKKLKDQAVNLTERLGRVVQAGAAAATEVAVGTVRVATGTVTGFTQSVADTINTAVKDSTKVAQRSVDKFFSVLDAGFGDAVKERPADAAPPSEPKTNA